MADMTLTPELEAFAAEAIAAGRYRDVAEVVRTGVELPRRHEQARAELLASVLAAKAEADRDGCVSGDEMLAHVRETIARRSGVAA